jgi:hypothetical protein
MIWSHEIGDTTTKSIDLVNFKFPQRFKIGEDGITTIQTTSTGTHVTELKIVSGKGKTSNFMKSSVK